jgi:hypothetical protein
MSKESHIWLPKFIKNNVITVQEHLDDIDMALEDNGVEQEDVAMKLLASSLDGDVKKWFKSIPDNHLQLYQAFANFLKKRWTMKKDNGMLLMQFNQTKKKENETVDEFDARFDNFLSKIPKYLCPPVAAILLLYLNSFEGNFGFILKEKTPDSLTKSKEYSVEIEEHIISSKIEPFQFPRARAEPKTKTSTNSVQDLVTLLAQIFYQMNTQFV